ncbi:MAG: GAF domain-containing protein [Desulfuromonadales bacterium]|nr:GAF domain-containing protein [Desulfuromonadales bacterium]NIR33842.1 GAF domain-containing protein [Desulfuromonadales bacterium]NIS42522.1 GAF domain-containing protein [Desulfuromonadales bacterium]
MVDPNLAVLNRIIRLAHAHDVPASARIKRILRLLQRSLALHDASIFFRRDRGRQLCCQISARSRSDFVSPPVDSPPKGLSRTSPRFSDDDGELVVPLTKGRRRPAVLVLKGCPASLADERDFLDSLSCLLVSLLDRLGAAAEASGSNRQLEELALLNMLSRALHGTLQIDVQMHVLLSGLVLPEGGFERAMLFMVNERSGILQGMLGVTRDTARRIFPPGTAEAFAIDRSVVEEQDRHSFSQLVRQQRLPLDPKQNALSRAALRRRITLVNEPAAEPPQFADMAKELGLQACACLPLYARDHTRAVIVADNPHGGSRPRRQQQRFLELFAKQAGQALENSLLVQRLEHAHEELQATQEELIQGEKLAAIGEMAASVAHELKNPLVVVGGFAKRLMRTTAGDSKASQYAGTIAREVDRLEEMLANILAFSRKSIVCLALCDPAEIIDDALVLGRGGPNQEGIAYEVVVEKGLPQIQGDEQKLRQVLVNLLVNARQSLNGEGRVTLRARRGMLRGEDAVVFEVDDTGGGIPSSIMRNIFNPFFTTREEGTGLGLPIAQRIVEQHYGHIDVQNSEQGASFRIALPVRPPHARPC